MALHREDLHAFAHRGHLEERIGFKHDALLLVPGVGIGFGAAEHGHLGDAVHLHIHARRVDQPCRHGPAHFQRELQAVVEGVVAAADDGDLQVDGVAGAHTVGVEFKDAHALAFQEAFAQPALHRTGGAHAQQAVDEHIGPGLQREQVVFHVFFELHQAFPDTVVGEHRQRDGVQHLAGSAAQGRREHDAVGKHLLDQEIAIESGRCATDADLVAHAPTFFDEAAQVGARAAREGGEATAVAEHDGAAEALGRLQAADGLVAGGDDRAQAVANLLHVGQAVGEDGHVDRCHGLAGEADGVRVVNALVTRHGRVVVDHQRGAAAFQNHRALGFVVDHFHVEQGRVGSQVWNDVVVADVHRAGVLDELEHRGLGVFAHRVVQRLHIHAHAHVPVEFVERDGAGEGVKAAAATVAERDGRVIARAEVDADDDGLAGIGLLRQLNQERIAQPGGARALDHQRAAIVFGRVVGVDLGDLHPGGVVVDHGGLDVAHIDAVVERTVGQHRVLDHHDAVALGAWIVRGVNKDVLGQIPVGVVEAQHDGALVHLGGYTVDVDAALEVSWHNRNTGIDFGEPDAVAQTINQRGGIEVVAVAFFLVGARGRDGDVHHLTHLQRLGQAHGVEVEHAREVVVGAVLFHQGAAVGGAAGFLVDDHQAFALDRHVVVDAVDEQTVVEEVARGHEVLDPARGTFELAGDDVFGHVAGHVDGVGPQATDDSVGHPEFGGLHEELVVAFQAIDLDHLNGGVGHAQAGTKDALLGDHDVVGELGAQNHQLVKAGSTVHRDRGVDVVAHLVVAATGADVGRLRHRETPPDLRRGHAVGVEHDGVVAHVVAGEGQVDEVDGGVAVDVVGAHTGRRCAQRGEFGRQFRAPGGQRGGVAQGGQGGHGLGNGRCGVGHPERFQRFEHSHAALQIGLVFHAIVVPVEVHRGREREGPHDEQVVLVVTLQPQGGLVAVDPELVVAAAALGHQRGGGAGREPAAGGGHEVGEHVLREQVAFGLVAVAAEDLTHLEQVKALSAVQRGDHGGVIAVEGVVSALAFNDQTTVQAGVVVDALHLVGRLVAQHHVFIGGYLAVQHGHIAWVVFTHFAWNFLAGTQQEDVVGGLFLPQVVQTVLRAVVAVNDGFVHTVVRLALVQDVDDVVAGVSAVGADGVDEIAVAAGLAVQRERVLGHHGCGGGRGAGGGVLQVINPHAVFAVVVHVAHGHGVVGRAVHPGLAADEDVARAALRHATGDARGVAELDGVDFGVAVDLEQARRGGQGGHGHANGACAVLAAGGGQVGPRDQAPAQDHVGPAVEVCAEVVALEQHAQRRDDGRVLVGEHVVTHQQLDAAFLGEDLTVGNGSLGVELVPRQGGGIFGKSRRAAVEQQEVLVEVTRLVHRQADVAVVGVCQDDAQLCIHLGEVDVLGGFQGHVVNVGDQVAAQRGDVGRIGAQRHRQVGREGARSPATVDLNVVADLANAAAVGIKVDRLAEHVGFAVHIVADLAVQDGAGLGSQRHVFRCFDGVEVQVARHLVDKDALRVAGGSHVVGAQHPGGVIAVGHVDFQEVGGLTHPADRVARTHGTGWIEHLTGYLAGVRVHEAGGRHHRDAAPGHVGLGVVVPVGIQDALWREQQHVAGGGGDAVHAHVTCFFCQRDPAIGQDRDVAFAHRVTAAGDLGDRQHVDGGVGRIALGCHHFDIARDGVQPGDQARHFTHAVGRVDAAEVVG